MKYIVLIVLVCANSYLIWSGMRRVNSGSGVGGHNEATVIIPYLYMEQLDPRNLNKCHRRFNLVKAQLLSTGVAVSRSGGGRGDIFLDCAYQETLTVGEEHAVVALDEYGCFIQNRHANGMRILRGGTLVQADEIEIEDGTVLYLGEQPVRFSYPQITEVHHCVSVRQIWKVIQMFLGNLIGFSRRNRKNTQAQRSERDMW